MFRPFTPNCPGSLTLPQITFACYGVFTDKQLWNCRMECTLHSRFAHFFISLLHVLSSLPLLLCPSIKPTMIFSSLQYLYSFMATFHLLCGLKRLLLFFFSFFALSLLFYDIPLSSPYSPSSPLLFRQMPSKISLMAMLHLFMYPNHFILRTSSIIAARSAIRPSSLMSILSLNLWSIN